MTGEAIIFYCLSVLGDFTLSRSHTDHQQHPVTHLQQSSSSEAFSLEQHKY